MTEWPSISHRIVSYSMVTNRWSLPAAPEAICEPTRPSIIPKANLDPRGHPRPPEATSDFLEANREPTRSPQVTCNPLRPPAIPLIKMEAVEKILFFRCEEHLYTRLRSLVGPLVRRSVPHDAITWKTGYIAIASRGGEGRGNWLRRDSIMSRFLRT
jgi:hypothetical protein